jgi:hypothetical protein
MKNLLQNIINFFNLQIQKFIFILKERFQKSNFVITIKTQAQKTILYVKQYYLLRLILILLKIMYDILFLLFVLIKVYLLLIFESIKILFKSIFFILKIIKKIIKGFFFCIKMTMIYIIQIFFYLPFFLIPYTIIKYIFDLLYLYYGKTKQWEFFKKYFKPIQLFLEKTIIAFILFCWNKWKLMTHLRDFILIGSLVTWVFYILIYKEEAIRESISRTGQFYYYRYHFKPIVHPISVISFIIFAPMTFIWAIIEWYKWKFPEDYHTNWSGHDDQYDEKGNRIKPIYYPDADSRSWFDDD